MDTALLAIYAVGFVITAAGIGAAFWRLFDYAHYAETDGDNVFIGATVVLFAMISLLTAAIWPVLLALAAILLPTCWAIGVLVKTFQS